MINGLTGLQIDQQLVVVFHFHQSIDYDLCQHPQGNTERPKRGVFALRSPRRPNPIGITVVKLLAIEQNAWILASRDRRCMVVGTRTELDWAMKNGQICVWAPSKIVLDAVDGPSAGPH